MCHLSILGSKPNCQSSSAFVSTDLAALVCVRPRLRVVPLVAAAANLAADLQLLASLAIPLVAYANVCVSGWSPFGRTLFLPLSLSALLQLLGRSAADIVREDTDREMAT